jgi:hypothetical protein
MEVLTATHGNEIVTNWDEAFTHQICKIRHELMVAKKNYRHTKSDLDLNDVTDVEKWLTATIAAKSLYKEGYPVSEIPKNLASSCDLDFTCSDSLLKALLTDNFELMINW